MKRDMDLMRDILLWLEAHDSGFPQIPERDEVEIGYHCHLLSEAGLIKAANTTTSDDRLPQAIPISLTSRGHDFIDDAQKDTVWTAVKKRVLSASGAVSTALLTELVKDEARRSLGLP